MRLSLAKKISLSVGGVVVLAVLSSVTALLSSWHIGDLLRRTVNENLPSVVAAEELEVSVLEQRGFAFSYVLDGGNQKWLEQLHKRASGFHGWLNKARQTAHAPKEREILKQLEGVYAQYDAKRTEAVHLYDQGEAKAAEQLLVNDVHRLSEEAYRLCEQFIEANQQYIKANVARTHRQTRWVSWAVSGCVLLTIGLGGGLLWLFFYGVFFPLRAMIVDARGFAGEASGEDRQLPTDELRAVGIYLRNLMTDVTDARTTLERSREQLRASERLAAVGKLAASVAHEIRNPLTSVKMWLFSIQQEVGGDAALDRKFEIVSEEIGRLEKIVRNFMEFSRPSELKLAVESMAEILDKTLELMGPRMADHKIEVARRDAAGLPPVLVDAEQLRQVLINLLNNAAEAAGENGQIRVAATAESEGEGRKMVVVRVSDSGTGMSEEVQQRIFEPFFTTKDEGTGLGLCIAARIMARHKGRLVLESSDQQGTTFALYVPLAPGKRR
jgi:signal transduction histidine kinase